MAIIGCHIAACLFLYSVLLGTLSASVFVKGQSEKTSVCSSPVPQSPYFIINDNCMVSHRQMDKATVTYIPHNIPTDLNLTWWLAAQVSQCYKCCALPLLHLPMNRNCSFLVDTKFSVDLYVYTNNETQPDNITLLWSAEGCQLSQHSKWTLLVTLEPESSVQAGVEHDLTFIFYQAAPGEDANLPIYVALAIIVVISIAWICVRYIYRNRMCNKLIAFCQPNGAVNSDLGSPPVLVNTPSQRRIMPDNAALKKRVRSLDAFRGLCLVVMIFVNYGGGGYWFFDHSFWNGLTVADLVFPWFTWIIGTAIALSFNSLLLKGNTRLQVLGKVVKRTFILFGLGIALNSNDGNSGAVSMRTLRIPGVLQRLAVSYCVVALIHIIFAQPSDPHRHKWWSGVRDVVSYWVEWVVCLSLLATHILLTFLLPIPNCPKGYLGPGGIQDDSKYENCTGGAARYIDSWLFGDHHIYQTPTCKETYMTTVPHDPEGVLGTITSIFICFLGLQAGKILLLFEDWHKRVIRWVLWAVILGTIAGVLCKFSQNEGWIPVNKNLWSVSFILCLSSLAFCSLSIFYILIDVFHLWSGAPFYFPGSNSILVYVCHMVFGLYLPVSWQVPSSHASLLALHLWGVTFWITLSAVLHHKGIFIAI